MVQGNEEAVAEQDVLTPPVIPNTASQLCKEITMLAKGDALMQRDEKVLNALKVALARIKEINFAQDRL